MTGHFGFSYTGLIFLLLLFIPNIIWTGKKPQGYTSQNENKFFLLFERTGEILVTICRLAAAFIFMVMYELWWIRYFKSEHTLPDFYSSFLGIPLAGATLPVISFFLLSIYGKVIWLSIATIILGIGHIGIHIQHKMELKNT